MEAQELRDLRAARDDLERRVHDLKLTRQVTMQSLPSIRLVQENDKALVTKINSTLVNTVPLWETQLAQAVTIQRSREAAGAVHEANDLTNELLTAERQEPARGQQRVRTEMERGVFDIEAVKAANAEPDRHDRGEPADRRRGQGPPRRRRRGTAARWRPSCATRWPPPRRAGTGPATPAASMIGALRSLAILVGAGCWLAALRACRRRDAPRRAPAARPPHAAEPEPPRPRPSHSDALERYYARVQNGLLAQGLLRTDGGAPRHALHGRATWSRTSMRIALYDEYATVDGRLVARQTPSRLRRWEKPVRLQLVVRRDGARSGAGARPRRGGGYAARLARVTGHPVSGRRGRATSTSWSSTRRRAGRSAPAARACARHRRGGVDTVLTLPRSTYCLVFASIPPTPAAIDRPSR